MLTKELVNELLFHSNGELFWKKNGKKAGGINGKGYVYVRVKGIKYQAHRIIFFIERGYFPENIDHIDGNPSNNKIENLRPATRSQNMQNGAIPISNTSGFKGVCWHKRSNKWQVRLSLNNKNKHFGMFEDIEFADLVAQEARSLYHGEYARNQ